MSEADRIREEIAYLKLWLGVALVTAISLTGWLFSGREVGGMPMTVASWLLLAGLVRTVFVLHRHIDRLIYRTGKLNKWKRSTRSSLSSLQSRSA